MIKSMVQRAAGKLGYRICRLPADTVLNSRQAVKELLGGCPQPLVVDAGANIGQSAEWIFEMLPAAKVYAIEASPRNYRVLCERFRQCRQLKAQNVALSDHAGEVTFYESGGETPGDYDSQTNSLFYRNDPTTPVGAVAQANKVLVKVPCSTLDRIVTEEGVLHCHLLKMDIEGAELLALKGAEGLLARQAIDVLYVEVSFTRRWDSAPLMFEIWQQLDRFGYSLYNIYNAAQFDRVGQLRVGDAVFLSGSFKERIAGGPGKA